MRLNWYNKKHKEIRQPNANLLHMLWDMIKFSTSNLSQIIFSEKLFLLMDRISEKIRALNKCCLNKDGALEETVKEKRILQSQCRFFVDNTHCK